MSAKSIARTFARHKPIGIPLAWLLGKLGDTHHRARVLEFCGHMPRSITIDIPQRIATPPPPPTPPGQRASA